MTSEEPPKVFSFALTRKQRILNPPRHFFAVCLGLLGCLICWPAVCLSIWFFEFRGVDFWTMPAFFSLVLLIFHWKTVVACFLALTEKRERYVNTIAFHGDRLRYGWGGIQCEVLWGTLGQGRVRRGLSNTLLLSCERYIFVLPRDERTIAFLSERYEGIETLMSFGVARARVERKQK